MNIGNLFKAFKVGQSVTSGNGAGGVVGDIAIMKHSRQLEKMLMTSASAYSAGYSSSNMAEMGKLASIFGAASVVWLVVSYVTSRPYTDEDSDKVKVDTFSSVKASGAAIAAGLGTMYFINTMRKNGTFTTFAGDNLISIQALTLAVPFVSGTILFKLASNLDLKGSALVSSLLSVVALVISRKTYMKFKLNDLEKTLFLELADVIEKCKDSVCDHKHAGYMEVYTNSIAPFIERMSRFLPEPMDPIKILRTVAEKQNLDIAKAFF